MVTGTDGLTSPTAELTWALILAVCRNVCAEDRAIREDAWQHTIGPELAGRTLGVAGLGRLGSRIAAIGQAFEMDVIAGARTCGPSTRRRSGSRRSARRSCSGVPTS